MYFHKRSLQYQQSFTCVVIHTHPAIRFEPSYRGRAATGKVIIGGEADETTVIRGSSDRDFLWDLKIPRSVPLNAGSSLIIHSLRLCFRAISHGASVDISLTPKFSSKPPLESTISFNEIYGCAQRSETSMLLHHQVSIHSADVGVGILKEQPNGKITIIIKAIGVSVHLIIQCISPLLIKSGPRD